METITVRPRNNKEKTLIKTFLKALNLEIEETNDKNSFPNKVTTKSIENTKKGIGITKSKSHQDLMEKLLS